MTVEERIIGLWKRGQSVYRIRCFTGASEAYVLEVIKDYLRRNGE